MLAVAALGDANAEVVADEASTHVYERLLHFAYLKRCFYRITMQNENARSISDAVIRKVALKLKDSHLPARYQPPKLDRSEIQVGVLCPACAQLSMKRSKFYWHCEHCRHRSKNAHWEDLLDYFYLMGDTITNQECRSFLRVENAHTAKTLMKNCPLVIEEGNNRGRKYRLKK